MPNQEPTNKHDGMKALKDWVIGADEYFRLGSHRAIGWLPVFILGGKCNDATLQPRDWPSVRNGLLAWIEVIDGLADAPGAQSESEG